MTKINCWEFMKCGHGDTTGCEEDKDICPAFLAMDLHGTHGGMNGGRVCWAIAGTLCGDTPQGVYATKRGQCTLCAFYMYVHREEDRITPVDEILRKHHPV